MTTIRVGVFGSDGAGPVESVEEVAVSRLVLWVEIDGQRVSGGRLTAVSGTWTGEGAHTTTVEFIGLPEFVYCRRDGTPL